MQSLLGKHMYLGSSNIEPNARLDIDADVVWGKRFEQSFLTFVCLTHSPIPINLQTSLAATYGRHEREKTRQYEQRVKEVEYASFSPLVFQSLGSMGRIVITLYKRSASMLVERDMQTPYSQLLGLIRCCLSLIFTPSIVHHASEWFLIFP